MLCLPRMTDQKRSARKGNLTIRWLPELCENSDICNDPEPPKELKQLVEEAVRLTDPARMYSRTYTVQQLDGVSSG